MELMDVSSSITRVRELIDKHSQTYERNEEAVRNQLVNPILRSLGWDPEDPDMVVPNIRMQEGNVPDYTLKKDNKTVLFIEAKNLGTQLETIDVIRQLSKYCYEEGTAYGVLTNGQLWLLFEAFSEGKRLNERILWKADLETEGTEDVSAKLSTIARNNASEIGKLAKGMKVLDEAWAALPAYRDDVVLALIPVLKYVIGLNWSEYHFEDDQIKKFLTDRLTRESHGNQLPFQFSGTEKQIVSPKVSSRQFRMKIGDKEYDLESANQILVHTANWLIASRKLTKNNCPVPVGPKRYLVNSEPRHKDGKKFFFPKKLSNGLWIEANYSRKDCENQARNLLEKFGVSSKLLVVNEA